MNEALDLKSLSRLADVTPRTVHFYIQQGVLPPAVGRGPGARYTANHLERLRLIRRLQREHLPLAEIRQRLTAMTDQEVALALAESASQPQPPPPGESALDYVRGILARSDDANVAPDGPAIGLRRPGGRRIVLSRSFARLADALEARARTTEEPLLLPAPARPSAPVSPVTERSQWDRILLAPDVELHLRRPLTRDMNRRVEKLLDAARDLLKEK